jgi:hypothetical protein
MIKAIYTYTVIDEQTKETILDHVSNDEVSKRIGIEKKRIADYVKNNRLYQRRYRIYKHVEMIEEANKEPKKKLRTLKTQEDMKEWDRVRLLINPEAKR